LSLADARNKFTAPALSFLRTGVEHEHHPVDFDLECAQEAQEAFRRHPISNVVASAAPRQQDPAQGTFCGAQAQITIAPARHVAAGSPAEYFTASAAGVPLGTIGFPNHPWRVSDARTNRPVAVCLELSIEALKAFVLVRISCFS